MAKPMSFKQLFDLSGRTALITGSTRGLGLSYAEGLAEAGAHVIINGTRPEGVTEAIAKLAKKGHSISGLHFDVGREGSVVEAFEAFDRQGLEIDILINNAGIQFRKPMVDLGVEDWQKVLDVNLTGSFIIAREAAKRMIARGRGGKIVNIASLVSAAGRATVAPYTASKGAITAITRTMAVEWAPHNIQANAIGPGYILTDMNQALIDNKEFDAWVRASNPSGRWGKPEELVGAAIFLSSSASDYINGQTLYVDGGWLAQL
ncbi:gluconate 5-dehydrogenase [Tianweitania populi]|uniref:Gluconate 5-dehydrogenase n=2 Tax=Tianweitania populi TaxID=1607949 RepID=A0A8J3GK50_9HYPH|nr:gluconate 5-dehydrogenase [Tianweitania populi]